MVVAAPSPRVDVAPAPACKVVTLCSVDTPAPAVDAGTPPSVTVDTADPCVVGPASPVPAGVVATQPNNSVPSIPSAAVVPASPVLACVIGPSPPVPTVTAGVFAEKKF